MKVWVVYLHCGICGEFRWGGVFSKEEDARKKETEINAEYNEGFHKDYADCDEYEVQ